MRKKSAKRTQSCHYDRSECSLCLEATNPNDLFPISFKTLLEKPDLIEQIESKHRKDTEDIGFNFPPSFSKKVFLFNFIP